MKRATVIGAVVALSAIAWLMVVSHQPREPAAHGRPLSYWMAGLNKMADTTPKEHNGLPMPHLPQPDLTARQSAREAIKEMGANALPELIQMLRLYDSPARKQLVSWASKHAWLKSKLKLRPPAEEDWCHALEAINCLGPAGEPALPDILPLVTNQNYAVKIRAIFDVTSIAPETRTVRPVVPILFQALGDKEWTMRLAAQNALAALRPPPQEVTPAFVQLLHDPQPRVSEAAMNYLVARTNTVVIPLLDKQLNETDSYVVTMAASHLGTFGAAAAASVPRLRQLLNAPVLTVRQAATNALAAVTGQPLSNSATDEKADITLNFHGIPWPQFLNIYEDMAGRKVMMAAKPKGGLALRVITARPLTKSEALQLCEEVLKEQAGLLIVHGKDGSLTAVPSQTAKPWQMLTPPP